MSEFKHVDGKVVIESLEDIDKYIEETFPDGLEAKRKKDFFWQWRFYRFQPLPIWIYRPRSCGVSRPA